MFVSVLLRRRAAHRRWATVVKPRSKKVRKATYKQMPCRCPGVPDVTACRSGCVLYLCCGGYVGEGHVVACEKPSASHICGESYDLARVGSSTPV